MIKGELIKWYGSIYSEKMPRYVEISDANNSQIFIDGAWKNVVFVWSIFFVRGEWEYVETDGDRGYVFDLKCFDTEEDATEYARETLNKKYLALNGNSKEEMLCRFIQQKFGCSEKRAKTMVDQLIPYADIFAEFFNYARVGKYCKKDKSKTEVCGYTAERLIAEYNLSPLGAYNFLVYLREDPEHALKDLKAGLSRK